MKKILKFIDFELGEQIFKLFDKKAIEKERQRILKNSRKSIKRK